ncbi:hypothetical protein B0T11DRAFT_285048 [Plectosphaerella cucumerina]|uniref:Uncharacterized protein n=1 Tax=Plectosphaerella cucumerina TaxID=40658 RepID=A0A8K0THX6_9PEZI|nr:hypothetical protein B0T11DRAFT_285048 [Plectosphaerella cucumerina]
MTTLAILAGGIQVWSSVARTTPRIPSLRWVLHLRGDSGPVCSPETAQPRPSRFLLPSRGYYGADPGKSDKVEVRRGDSKMRH